MKDRERDVGHCEWCVIVQMIRFALSALLHKEADNIFCAIFPLFQLVYHPFCWFPALLFDEAYWQMDADFDSPSAHLMSPGATQVHHTNQSSSNFLSSYVLFPPKTKIGGKKRRASSCLSADFPRLDFSGIANLPTASPGISERWRWMISRWKDSIPMTSLML